MDEPSARRGAVPLRRWANGRIEIVREIGAGGMGIVYEGFDRERNAAVAVKTLARLNGPSLLLFKREFRALQDIQHENLVQYGELFEEDGLWFFTMELLSGVDLYEHVCGAAFRELSAANTVELSPSKSARQAQEPVPPQSASLPARNEGHTFDESRLRESMRQMVQGLRAIHAAQKVHRDIKPANVLVQPDGRVVILDFGVVGDARDLENHAIVGTAHFMAPEQASGDAVGPAADFYALGSALYLCLTGRPPFASAEAPVLSEKLARPPVPPSTINPRVPCDLEALCMDLLKITPDARPRAQEILARLGGAAPAADEETHVADDVFVGRQRELSALGEAFAETRRGHAAACFVHGVSGVGKSALVRRFLGELRASTPDAVVVGGRCYERESMPYKAVDELVDAVAVHLAALPVDEATKLAPKDLALLTRVFPVLTSVAAFRYAPTTGSHPAVQGAQEMRARVFGALRSLLGMMARERPLVAYIDDLQWADADSLALLAEVLRSPDPPPLLLIGTVRTSTDGAELHTVGELKARLTKAAHEVRIEPLAPGDSLALAQALGGAKEGGASAASIAAEAGGHPLFIAELVRHRQRNGEAGVHLDDVIWSRASALDETARRLLEAVVLVGVPVRMDIAAEVVGVAPDELMRIAAALRVGQLVRTSGPRIFDAIEPYHDRVRETVAARIAPETARQWHRGLAEAFEKDGRGDAEMLALQWGKAGENGRALRHILEAAEHATRVLAFDRAADLYGRALELHAGDAAGKRDLLHKRAEALANAGRCGEAASDFAALAASGDGAETQEMNRRAALEYFKSGHYDAGLERMRQVLADVGMALAPTQSLALVSLLVRRGYLRLRGFGFRPRAEAEIPKELRDRIDATWAVSLGLMSIELFHAADFLTRNVLLALAAGDRDRIGRSLGLLVSQIAIEGSKTRKRTEQLLGRCEELAQGSAYARAWTLGGRACAEYSLGNWALAREATAQAIRAFKEENIGSSYEMNNLIMFQLWTLYYLGEVRELSARTGALVEDARQRGDQFFEHHLRTGFPLVTWLAADRSDEARDGLTRMVARWSRRGFHAQHWWGLTGAMLVELYDGDPREAHARLCREWGALQRSLLPRMQNVRIEAWDMRARGALAIAGTDAHGDRILRQARADARRIEREEMPWATPLAQAIYAAVDFRKGQRERALAGLARAEEGFRAADMALFAAAAQRRRGELIGGAAGQALIDQADAWMRTQGIARPARMVDAFAPRFVSG